MKKTAPKVIQFAKGEVLYVGIDASKSHLAIAIVRRVGEEGSLELMLRAKVPYHRDAVLSWFRSFAGAKLHVAYEAGPTGYMLVRWLRELGCTAYMTPPSMMPVASGERVKTNNRDAIKLATLAAGFQLKRVTDLTDEQYADREVVRARRQAVEARSDIARQIKSMLLFHGVDLEEEMSQDEDGDEMADNWSKRFVAFLGRLELRNKELTMVLREHLRRYKDADRSVQRLTKQVKKLAASDRYRDDVALLRTIPGIGVISGMEILVERGGDRFTSAAGFSAYTGLTPSESSTGDDSHRGHITRAGNKRLRTTLVEAAWRLRNRDPGLAEFYSRLVQRRGGRATGEGKRAIVAVARRLAVAIHAMLRDRTEYRIGAARLAA